VFVKVFYAYTLTACLLSLGVYFYGVALMTEQTHSGSNGYANWSLSAIIVPTISAGLYVSSMLATRWISRTWPGGADGGGLVRYLLAGAIAGGRVAVSNEGWANRIAKAKIDQLTKLEVALA